MSAILPNIKPFTDNATNELEHDNFIMGECRLPVQLVTNAGTDFPIAFIEETVGDTVYRGEVLNPYTLADTSANFWLISKTRTVGGRVVKEYASQGYNQNWDSRHTIFPLSTYSDYNNTKAIKFDGISEFLHMGNRMYRNLTEKWTIAFWFKPRTVSTDQVIFSKLDLQEFSGRQIRMVSNGKLRIEMFSKDPASKLIMESKNDPSTGLEIFQPDIWHFVMIAMGGGSSFGDTTVWVDGVRWVDWANIQDNISGTGSHEERSPAYIGKSILAGMETQFLDGILDEMIFSDSHWADTEAEWLWNGGVPKDVQELINTSGLTDVRYWFRMGDGDGDAYPYTTPVICNESGSESGMVSLRGVMRNMDSSNYTPEAAV